MRLALAALALVVASPAGAAPQWMSDEIARRDMQAAAVTLSIARLYSGKIVVTSPDDAHFADYSVSFHRDEICRIGLYGKDKQSNEFNEVWDFAHLTGEYHSTATRLGFDLSFLGDGSEVRCFKIPSSGSACLKAALVPGINGSNIPIIVSQIRRIIEDCKSGQ